MSDMIGGSTNDLIRNLTRQGLSDTLQQVDQAKADAEAERKRKEQEEQEAKKKRQQEKIAKNTRAVPTHPRFDPELVKRCEGHKKMVDNWIEACTSVGKIVGKEWDEIAYGPKFIHIYYQVGKRLIDDILQGNYVAAGYVTENFKPFTKMQDVALITLCMEIWAITLMKVGAIEQAKDYADTMVVWGKKFEAPMINACEGGERRGPYPVFTAFAHSDPKAEVIDDNEVRTRYERLMRYASSVMREETQLHFVD